MLVAASSTAQTKKPSQHSSRMLPDWDWFFIHTAKFCPSCTTMPMKIPMLGAEADTENLMVWSRDHQPHASRLTENAQKIRLEVRATPRFFFMVCLLGPLYAAVV